MTIEESKMMWKLEVENNKPLYSSFSKEMKRLYNKVDELINEGVITYEDFTNDVIDSITTTIVDNGKNNAEPSRADQVNAMCDMLFKKYEEYKKVDRRLPRKAPRAEKSLKIRPVRLVLPADGAGADQPVRPACPAAFSRAQSGLA